MTDRARDILSRIVGCDDVAELRAMAEVIASVPSDDRGVMLEAISFLLETHPSACSPGQPHRAQRVTTADLEAVRAAIAMLMPEPDCEPIRDWVSRGSSASAYLAAVRAQELAATAISEPVEVRELPTLVTPQPKSVGRDDDDALRIVRELRALMAADDGWPEGPMGPSWILGQVRQILGLCVEPDAETLDLSEPGVEADELGGEA